MKRRTIMLSAIGGLALLLLFVSCPGGAKADFKLFPASVSLKEGESTQIQVIELTKDKKPAGPVTWKSNNPALVKVDQKGTLTGVLAGEHASVTASRGEGKQTVLVTVTPAAIVLDETVVTVKEPNFTGYRYQIFESEKELEKQLSAFLPKGTAFRLTDFVFKSVTLPEETLLGTNKTKFAMGQRVVDGLFGTETALSGEPKQTLSKKMEFTLALGSLTGLEVPFVWKGNPDAETLTLPDEGTVLFTNDDFVLSNLYDTGFDLIFLNLQSKIGHSFSNGKGEGTVAFTVKKGEETLATKEPVNIPEDGVPLKVSVTGLTAHTEYADLTVEIKLTLTNSSNNEKKKIDNKIKFSVTTPISFSVTVNPLHLSVARVTQANGTPEPKASALFNWGAEMWVLLNKAIEDNNKGSYDQYDFDKATWSADFIHSGSKVASVSNAPYKKRVEFDLLLDKEYQLTLNNAFIVVPPKSKGSPLQINCRWSSEGEPMFGKTLTVKKDAEFPEVIYFDEQFLKAKSGTRYKLVQGDDFNYHFNGLNYKSWGDYQSAIAENSDDAEATALKRMWHLEEPKSRRDFRWDFRNTETRNSLLLSKVIATDRSGTIYLGKGKTKGVKGFDLGTGEGDKEALSGSATSGSMRFGYTEAKIRVRGSGYKGSAIPGAWYAYWWYGPLTEYDFMEALPKYNRCEQVTHFHNGWGGGHMDQGAAKTYGQYKLPDQNTWFTLACLWDENRVIYYYNGKKMLEQTVDSQNYQKKTNTWHDLPDIWSRKSISNGQGPTTKAPIQWGNPSGQNCSPVVQAPWNPQTTNILYGKDKLKAISDDPKEIHLSTEVGNDKQAGSLGSEASSLPGWMEVEYCTYYLPWPEGK